MNKLMVLGVLLLIAISLVFSWLIAFGPLWSATAYPGDMHPYVNPTFPGIYIVMDCYHARMWVGNQSIPLSDGEIYRVCGGDRNLWK